MSTTRMRAYILLAAAAWTIWVWVTRIWNILNDQHPFGFKLVHSLLAVVSVAFGIAIGVIGWRLHREAGRTTGSGSTASSGTKVGA
jgi:hypothetical protein